MVRVTEVVHTKKHHKHKKIPKLISSRNLFKAVEKNNIAGTKFLLEHGISPNATHPNDSIEYKSLHWIISKNGELIEIEVGIDTPLHIAANNGYTTVVKILLENGAFINARDSFGFTPLHSAIISSYKLSSIKLLLEYGTSLTLEIIDGYYRGKTPVGLLKKIGSKKDKKVVALRALLELEKLYRNKELDKIVKKTYIKEPHIKDFIKWKIEAEIPKFIKSNISFLNKHIKKNYLLLISF
ncbi:hypothetical protein A3306_07340 [Rickettsia bellii]|uniref:Putative ankyrin repeat protein RBE_0489 n=3 Tax=Rickettsia bellii TaxID=33990 RepID=Y489_RICBR|nr:ankyrin repeat domain-containing protein [Rickettsia bellii]Q1RJ94.1 RecName: Full=Putative ankyrin repeat protein RBE_0489 [Rickettsia bellii RML369-C]ABE04570.1 Ankyrin repeat [Rickettsia bellii RML369-C]ARD86906.1 hypothetical protein A3306_07340 [Rickettsia bellii]KJV89347.1 ankyrin repeat family protein [Rickettsia bellii str. RML An4]KJV91611.1 ankyrin repeat family protein [Rickettsia bellii str. RML Mogi]